MRDAFVKGLIEIAEKDDKVVLLMAEVGFGVVEPFEQRFPKRFFNTGISEQSLALNAAGLAISGFHPIAYSMSSFLPTRAFEMIKDSVCYQDLPVVLVGIGSGISYGEMGSTHHAIEESALMRCLPNMTVIFPSDGDECIGALKYAVSLQKPVYIGMEKVRAKATDAKKGFSPLWEKTGVGKDGAIISVGTMNETALKVRTALSVDGIDFAVYRANVVKPLDYEAINDALRSKRLLILDEHVSIGGVGESISAYILQSGQATMLDYFKIISIADEFPDVVYSMVDLLKRYNLTVDQIVKFIRDLMI